MNYKIIRSRRKSCSVQLDPPDGITVRAPYHYTDAQIRYLVSCHEKQILARLEKLKHIAPRKFHTPREVEEIRRRAEALLVRLEELSRLTGLSYRSARITTAQKRFGSCTNQERICLSCFLVDYPPELQDYVLLHELCHTREANHSKRFYRLLASVLPDWKEREDRLKQMPLPTIQKM